MSPESRRGGLRVVLPWLMLAPVLLPALSGPVLAASASACHCFQNRAYDPQARFAADDYILATTFNSLISKSFNLSKQRIVTLKMQGGVAADDLLIGLRLAQAGQVDSQRLFDRRKDGASWPTLLAELDLTPAIKESALVKQLQAGGSSPEAGELVADRMLAELFKLPPHQLQKLRSSGLDSRALSLVSILAHFTGREPEFFITQYQGENKSWSEIASLAGVEPKAAGTLILNYPEKRLSD